MKKFIVTILLITAANVLFSQTSKTEQKEELLRNAKEFFSPPPSEWEVCCILISLAFLNNSSFCSVFDVCENKTFAAVINKIVIINFFIIVFFKC